MRLLDADLPDFLSSLLKS